jgi:hypothetical protein
MANILSHTTNNISYSISNSWTTVLYSTLLISGSHLAKTEWKKYFMIWLAEHDQNHVGLGMVGIDFDNIYWLASDFEKQKEFVIEIAQNAIDEKSWTKLDYETNEETLTGLLNLWIDLFSKAQKKDIKQRDDFDWYNKPKPSETDMKCPVHHIFLNQLGNTEKECCYLCNNY